MIGGKIKEGVISGNIFSFNIGMTSQVVFARVLCECVCVCDVGVWGGCLCHFPLHVDIPHCLPQLQKIYSINHILSHNIFF